jgi:hypothetical protein
LRAERVFKVIIVSIYCVSGGIVDDWRNSIKSEREKGKYVGKT